MKRVVIDIDENYAGVLSLTCIGVVNNNRQTETNVTVSAVEISKYDYISVDSVGGITKDRRMEVCKCK